MTDRIQRSPAWEWLDLKVVETGEGAAVVEMATQDRMGNFQGTVHGGFISLLADSAMGRSVANALPPGERHFSFDLKLNFISPASPGEVLRASGRVLHAGRRTAVAECRVEAGRGRLVATATASFMLYLPGEQ